MMTDHELQIPVSVNEWVFMKGVFPLTDEEWSQMMRVLHAMKPALVQPACSVAGDAKETER